MNIIKQSIGGEKVGDRNKVPITVQLLLEDNKKIVLLKRKNTGYEDGKYCLPGGHVEKNEEIRQAMVREAKEEIGVDLNIEDLKLYKVLNRKIQKDSEYIDFIFKAEKWTGKITNEEKEICEEIIWSDIENIPDNTIDFIKDVLSDTSSVYLPYNWNGGIV